MTKEKRLAARDVSGGSGVFPNKFDNSTSKFFLSIVAHSLSVDKIRDSISAAAALVKVRHIILFGSALFTNKLNTLSVKTLVFPVPAEAETHTEVIGSHASFWLFSALVIALLNVLFI